MAQTSETIRTQAGAPIISPTRRIAASITNPVRLTAQYLSAVRRSGPRRNREAFKAGLSATMVMTDERAAKGSVAIRLYSQPGW